MSDYRTLDSTTAVDTLANESFEHPVAIFKHSTSCSISHLAKARLDKALKGGELQVPIYYLDLLRHRDVSNYIADRFGVQHQSPQLIMLQEGEPSYVATHLDIDPYALAPTA